ncbi:MAG: AMP-binding protein [Planctomycetes bacterium]|nr:AMP-binding protein [Planctomycetota bacterium]
MGNFYRRTPGAQQAETFRRLRAYLRDVVEPYHPAFRKAGIDAGSIRTPDDFARIPVTTKAEFRADPTAYILQPVFPGRTPLHETTPISRKLLARYAWNAATSARLIDLFRKQSLRERASYRACREWLPIHFHVSSGSTGEPTPVAYTAWDLERIIPELAASTVVRTDPPQVYDRWDHRLMNLFPGAPHLAFFQSVFTKLAISGSSFETFGGKVIPTDRQIEIFSRGRFNSIGAVPSYAAHWMRRAVDLVEAGKIRPFGEAFEGMILGAEALSDPMRRHLHELAKRLGAHPRFTILQTYGSTETKWAGTECCEESGIHLNPRYYFWELLHPETKEPVAPGEPGVLVFTHVGWRGTVFVRYWTGDLVKGGMLHERCPRCGCTFVTIRGPIARADKDFTKIRGTLVPLQELVTAIRDTAGVRNCQVVLDRPQEFGRDRMVVRLLPERGADGAAVAEAVRSRVRSVNEVTPDEVRIETDEAAFESQLFARTGIKAEYVVDRRDA